MNALSRSAAVLLAAVLVLSACTPTGQDGAPGQAGEFGDHVVTNAEVNAIYQAWLTETVGIDPATREQVMTAELLRPRALAKLEELGITMELELLGAEWMRHTRFSGQLMGSPDVASVAQEPSETLLRGMEGAAAIAVLARHPEGAPWLMELAEEVERDAIISPRFGAFSADEFIASIYRIEEAIVERSMANIFFVEYQHVNGIYPAERPWLTN